jgi:hypothetical protein
VRTLVEGVGGGHGAHDVDDLGVFAPFRQHLGGLHKQPEVAFAEGLPWPFGPVLEPVLGQQVTAVQLGRRPIVHRVSGPPGPPAGRVEGLRVQPRHRALRQQHDVVAEAEQAAGSPAHHAAGDVQRLVQVVGGRCPITVGPQHGHQRLAVHAMPTGQGQQLDQRLGLAQPPGVGGHRAVSHGDLEPTEKTDPYACVLSHATSPR